jgi:hypothetical protein
LSATTLPATRFHESIWSSSSETRCRTRERSSQKGGPGRIGRLLTTDARRFIAARTGAAATALPAGATVRRGGVSSVAVPGGRSEKRLCPSRSRYCGCGYRATCVTRVLDSHEEVRLSCLRSPFRSSSVR